eukprot:COSAG01_NODE_3900_length_5564_cov_6.249405_8_plen_50_part_00
MVGTASTQTLSTANYGGSIIDAKGMAEDVLDTTDTTCADVGITTGNSLK